MNFHKHSAFIVSILIMLVLPSANAILPTAPCESSCPVSVVSGGHCISVGKQRMYYRLTGHGNPTFIFSSGLGYPTEQWYQANIANQIAKKYRVFTYDRIYTFNSCPNTNNYMPNTAIDVAKKLHQLLIQEKIKPPYVLVGHSIGGLYMLTYARLFPKGVAAIVLMDATSTAGPTPLPRAAIPILKRLGNPQNPVPDSPFYNEMIGQLPSFIQSKTLPALNKNIPLVVMYATKHCLPKAWTGTLMCMTKAEEQQHVKQQMQIADMSNKHKIIIIDGSHNSFFSQQENARVIKTLLHAAQAYPQ